MDTEMTQPCTSFDDVLLGEKSEKFQDIILSVLGKTEATYLRALLKDIRTDDGTIYRTKLTPTQKYHIDLILDNKNSIRKLNTALWEVLAKLTLEQPQLLFTDIRGYAALLRTNHDLFYTQQWEWKADVVDVTKILRWLKWDEQIGMLEELIQEAIDRNRKYKQRYNTDEQVREVCSKLNYTRESLGNERVKHTINGISFVSPGINEFTFLDMREDWKYTMDGITKTKKYEKFQQETGMNKLSPEEVYELLWKFAKAMGITSTIDYDFFAWNSEKSQWLLQMFRDIIGFKGGIPIKITNEWNVQSIGCRVDHCWFNGFRGLNYYVAFLFGL